MKVLMPWGEWRDDKRTAEQLTAAGFFVFEEERVSHIRDALGDKFDAYVRRGGNASAFGQPCRDMDRDELLASLELAMEQYTASVEGHAQTRRMHQMFDDVRKARGWA